VVESWHIRSFSEAERTPGATVSDWVPSVAAAASGCFCEPEEGLWEEFVAMLGLDPEVESALETPPEQGSKAPARSRIGGPPQPVLCLFSRPEHALGMLGRRLESDTESDEGGAVVYSEIAELDEERPCAMHQDAERGHREEKRVQNGAGVIGEPDAREAALPQMVAAMETLLHAAGGDPGSDDVSTTSERYVRWLLSATQGSQLTLEWALAQRPPAQQNGCLGGVPVYKSLENGSANGDHRGQANGHVTGRNGCALHVTELSVPLVSQCEHHLLPFLGKAHVGYVLGGKSRTLERGQVEKIVALYSQRLQVCFIPLSYFKLL
jgi:GTP cyclohydrolase I